MKNDRWIYLFISILLLTYLDTLPVICEYINFKVVGIISINEYYTNYVLQELWFIHVEYAQQFNAITIWGGDCICKTLESEGLDVTNHTEWQKCMCVLNDAVVQW